MIPCIFLVVEKQYKCYMTVKTMENLIHSSSYCSLQFRAPTSFHHVVFGQKRGLEWEEEYDPQAKCKQKGSMYVNGTSWYSQFCPSLIMERYKGGQQIVLSTRFN